jgi:aspartyl-tRNA(Asn)/glutamyl-tRNA(Gln) amidotransferase subunit B
MSAGEFEPVIGLEVHAQLVTKSKVYCGCPAVYGAEPNTHVCPVCLGLPGALPVLNREAVSMAIRMGLATHCTIAPRSVFARKNYFYPDCPKNYQISMYDKPLCENGYLEIESGGETKRIGIERVHLEEDAGKLLHGDVGGSLVDFNRCGVALIEIVSRPDIRSPEDASQYLQMLRRTLRYLEICDGNMEEGSLRCDVNVSVRRVGEERMGTKTEIKNLNSFKAAEMGIRYEIDRQIDVIRGGGRITQVTNLWDADAKRLMTMRSKEYAHDYRYFPEPDLLPLEVDAAWIDEAARTMPELPLERERRFRDAYGLPPYDAAVLGGERALADYYEEVVRAGSDPKLAANWVMREVLEEVKSAGESAARDEGGQTAEGVFLRAPGRAAKASAFSMPWPLEPAGLAALVALVQTGAISGSAGREVFKEMVRSGESAVAVVARLGLRQVSAGDELEGWVDEAISASPNEVARYKAGKIQLLGFFVGQVMKRSGGKANPKIAGDLIKKKLGA